MSLRMLRARMLQIIASVGLLLLLLLPRISTAETPSNAELATKYGQWGAETLTAIDRDLWLPDRNLYAEKAKLGQPPTQPAYMWGAGVQLSALAAAAKFDPQKYTAQLTAYADRLQSYWVDHHGIGGYSVLPEQRDPDRYYDDNAWIVLALLDTYEATGDRKYIDRAAATMQFVLSGEEDTLGGGIYWRENERRSKNTCSNAPAIVAALRLYQATGDQHYLANAERLYKWTQSQLQDSDDGLYWDNVHLDGKVDRRKFTYNSAVMIRANCLLFEINHDPNDLAEAQRMAQSAAARWIVPDAGAVKDSGRFAHMLLESLLSVDQVAGDTRWQSTVGASLAFVHEHLRDPNGHYPSSWQRPQEIAIETFQLIDQASVARADFAAANFLRQKNAPAER